MNDSARERTGRRQRGPAAVLPAAAVWLMVVVGCGVETYEERLTRTNELFQYLNHLNENLSRSAWRDSYDFGVQMRVPKQFALIPPPPPPTEENPQPARDERQPYFLGIEELPGLIAAWGANLPTVDGGSLPAFLYVAGNHQRFLDNQAGEGGPEPSAYFHDLELLLQNTLGVTVPDGASGTGDTDNTWYEVTIPRTREYAEPKDFRAISFLPPPEAIDDIGGVPIRVQLYEYQPPDSAVQVAILMIYPVNVQGNPVEQLRLALETLEVNPEPPRARQPGETGGGDAPAF